MASKAKIVALVIGVPIALLLVPYFLLFVMFGTAEVKRDLAERFSEPLTLREAVCHKYVTPEMVTAFIDQGADVNERVLTPPDPPLTLIEIAANRCPRVEIARLLIHRGAKVDEAGLADVVYGGSEPMARMLIEEGATLAPVWSRSYEAYGTDLLQAAAYGGQAWLVPRLLAQGHDVQMVNAHGEGLLALSLHDERLRRDLAIVSVLLEAGAHVNSLQDGENPPLYQAVRSDWPEAVDLLLAAGAAVDAPVVPGPNSVVPAGARVTALSIAVEYCNFDIAERLLQRGASTGATIVASNGKSLSDTACNQNAAPANIERMRALLVRGSG